MTYDGSYPEFNGIYQIGEAFLHPSIRMQPLKATKDAAATAVEIIKNSGYDDLVGAVAYSGGVSWVEPLSNDYDRVRSRIRGTPVAFRTRIDLGIEAARIELESVRARFGTDKVIVLMTDGNSNPPQARAQAEIAADAGMLIYCIGLGTGVNKNLLEQIAAIGNGKFFYVTGEGGTSVYTPLLEQVFANIASQEVGYGLLR